MTIHTWLFVWYQNLIFFHSYEIHKATEGNKSVNKVSVSFVVWMDWCQFNIISIPIMWIFMNLNQKNDGSFPLQNIIFRFSSFLYALWYRRNILEVYWGGYKFKSLNTSFSKKNPKTPEKGMIKIQKRIPLLSYLRQWQYKTIFNISCKVDWNIWWRV